MAMSALKMCAQFLSHRITCNQYNRLLHTLSPLAKKFDVHNSDEFDEKVFDASKPVVVDFHAEWCGPCKSLGPLLEEAVNSTNDAVDLAKVDVDQVGEIAIKYGVSAVPAVFLVKDGRVVDKFVGLQDSKFLQHFVQQGITQ